MSVSTGWEWEPSGNLHLRKYPAPWSFFRDPNIKTFWYQSWVYDLSRSVKYGLCEPYPGEAPEVISPNRKQEPQGSSNLLSFSNKMQWRQNPIRKPKQLEGNFSGSCKNGCLESALTATKALSADSIHVGHFPHAINS